GGRWGGEIYQRAYRRSGVGEDRPLQPLGAGESGDDTGSEANSLRACASVTCEIEGHRTAKFQYKILSWTSHSIITCPFRGPADQPDRWNGLLRKRLHRGSGLRPNRALGPLHTQSYPVNDRGGQAHSKGAH